VPSFEIDFPVSLSCHRKNTLSDFTAAGCLMGEMQESSNAQLLQDCVPFIVPTGTNGN
jgi:hypothetical protein